jgi:hypothetical protein
MADNPVCPIADLYVSQTLVSVTAKKASKIRFALLTVFPFTKASE